MGGKSNCFWPEKPHKFSNSARKSLRISAKTFFFLFFFFFWRPAVFGRKTAWIFDFGLKKPLDFGEDLLFYFYFWRPPVFGWKNRLNFRLRPEKAFGFRWRSFFLEITQFSLKNCLNPIQKQWKFGSSSFTKQTPKEFWLRACSSLKFGQRWKSVPPCKILQFKYWL